jgi:hypothetical protein
MKFIYPDKFVWDNGTITQLTEDTDNQTLTADDSSTIKVDCTAFDVQDREIYVILQNKLSPEIKDKGRALLQFNNGQKIDLTHDFQRVIRYDGASYTEETDDNNIPTNSFTALTDTNDVIYLFSDKPFYGLEIDLSGSSNLVGTMSLSYSQGFSSWQSLTGFTDTTSNLSQDGSITWDKSDVEGWRETTIEPSGLTDVLGLYGVKIELSAHTSGSFVPLKIKRRIRLYGTDGRTIDINYDFLKFDNESLDEKLIIRRDNSGSWVPANWYRNIPLYQVVDTLLDKTEILDANRNIDNIALTTGSNAIHLFGQAPMPFYDKNVTAAVWDSSRSKWWLGVQNELWTFSETEGFELTAELSQTYINNSEYRIIKLVMDSNNYCQGVAYEWFSKQPSNNIKYVFRANTNGIETGTLISIHGKSGKQQWRNGVYAPFDPWGRRIGHHSAPSWYAGENLTIPFPQILTHDSDSDGELYDVNGLEAGTITDSPRFIFGDSNDGRTYLCPPGHYFFKYPGSPDPGWLGFRFKFGNDYTVIWDSANDRWVLFAAFNLESSPEFKIKWIAVLYP